MRYIIIVSFKCIVIINKTLRIIVILFCLFSEMYDIFLSSVFPYHPAFTASIILVSHIVFVGEITAIYVVRMAAVIVTNRTATGGFQRALQSHCRIHMKSPKSNIRLIF